MKKIIIFILILFLALLIRGTTVYNLPELISPHSIMINKSNVFIAAKSQVFRYRYPNTFIQEFGAKGEGPGEFREYFDMGLTVSMAMDNIIVSSRGKISVFDRNGSFIRERKTGLGHSYLAVKNHFVGIRSSREDNILYNNIVLIDENLKRIKILQRKPLWFQPGKRIDPVNVRNPRYCVMHDLIYAEDTRGIIHIYDTMGKEIGVAKADYQRVKVSARDQADYHEYYKNHKYYKERYHRLKHLIKFPEYYPPVKYFDCSKGKIYVLTYVRKQGANELYVFDKRGNFLEKMMVKMPDLLSQEVYPLIRIADDKIFQLIENQDEETWDLHVSDIGEQ